MSPAEVPPISDYIEHLIAERFSGTEQQEVRQLLLEYGTRDSQAGADRVRREILVKSGGDIARVRKLVELAKRDYRDVLSGKQPSIRGRKDVQKLPFKD
jgi:hypothetical protein